MEKDIASFIKEAGTGQEIPDPPKFINFCRGDISDAASETSNNEDYSVAQFQRTMNPAYRSSSPQPSTLESHHDPSSDLAQDLGIGGMGRSQPNSQDNTPRKPVRQAAQPEETQFRTSNNSQRGFGAQMPQREDFPEVPHNEYPEDGMTQFCRTDGPIASDGSSVASNMRPSSRDSHSELSNAASFTSPEPSLGAPSPTKGFNGSDLSQRSGLEGEKKKSGFFQNRSPFRRKSKSEKDGPESFQPPPGNRNTWAPSNTKNTRPGVPFGRNQNNSRVSPSPEPADPRASFQLNVGNNVFDVASPDATRKAQPKQQPDGQDEMARALAAVKDLTKQSSVRMSADRYAGMSTPAAGSVAGSTASSNPSRARPSHVPDRTRNQPDQPGPPPSYSNPPQPMSRLGAPQPAHTSRQMQQTTQRFAEQNRNMFNSSSPQSRPGTRGNGAGNDRATSPLPIRSTSPRPASYGSNNAGHSSQGNLPRAASPNPYLNGGGPNANGASRPRAQSTSPVKPRGGDHYGGGRPQSYFGAAANEQIPRARSPQPQFNAPRGGDEMAIQLAPGPGGNGYGPPSQYPPRGGAGGRPVSNYGGMAGPGGAPDQRTRSKSFGAGGPAGGGQQVARDGRPILHYGK